MQGKHRAATLKVTLLTSTFVLHRSDAQSAAA